CSIIGKRGVKANRPIPIAEASATRPTMATIQASRRVPQCRETDIGSTMAGYFFGLMPRPPDYTPVTALIMNIDSLDQTSSDARTQHGAAATPPSQAEQQPARTRKLYIRTFGCQMNEYDSDKMV